MQKLQVGDLEFSLFASWSRMIYKLQASEVALGYQLRIIFGVIELEPYLT